VASRTLSISALLPTCARLDSNSSFLLSTNSNYPHKTAKKQTTAIALQPIQTGCLDKRKKLFCARQLVLSPGVNTPVGSSVHQELDCIGCAGVWEEECVREAF
jgi:hypothetical protein